MRCPKFCSTRNILIGIFALAAFLRLWGVSWGMPYIFHPDERFMISRGVYFFSGDFNPHLFIYPSLLMYILFLFNGLQFIFARLFGAFPSLEEFTNLYHSDPATFYIPNRVVIVLFALLSIYVVYKIANEITNRETGLLAASLLAVLPVHVMHSHFVTTDVPCLAFVLLSFFYSLRIIDSGGSKNYILAAVFGGLAASIKYNGGMIVCCMIMAHWLRVWQENPIPWQDKLKRVFRSTFSPKLIFNCFLSVLVFILTSPYVILDFNSFLNDFLFQLAVQRRGHGLIFVGIENKIFYELFVVFKNWGGWPFLILIFAGLLYSLKRVNAKIFLFLFWIAIYSLALFSSNDLFVRYTILLIPFVTILAAKSVYEGLYESNTTSVKALAIGLFSVAFIYMTIFSFSISKNMSGTDARVQAKKWFEQTAAKADSVGIMLSATGMQTRDDPPIDSTYTIYRDRSLVKLFEKNPEWIMISSYDYVDYLRIGDKFDFTRENYYALKELRNEKNDYHLAKRFDTSPKILSHDFLGTYPLHDMMYPFSQIEIYQRKE